MRVYKVPSIDFDFQDVDHHLKQGNQKINPGFFKVLRLKETPGLTTPLQSATPQSSNYELLWVFPWRQTTPERPSAPGTKNELGASEFPLLIYYPDGGPLITSSVMAG